MPDSCVLSKPAFLSESKVFLFREWALESQGMNEPRIMESLSVYSGE